jgi:hypothetical protein
MHSGRQQWRVKRRAAADADSRDLALSPDFFQRHGAVERGSLLFFCSSHPTTVLRTYLYVY